MGEFKDKKILVTGGSRGIGLGVAKHFFNQGAKVAICSRKEANLQKARVEIGDILILSANISKAEEVDKLFQTIRAEFGGLDILVNNVGMNILTPFIMEADIALWEKILDSNLKSAFMCARQAFPLLREQGGVIVNISSIAGHRAAPGMGIYGIAKAGLNMLTKVLAKELASFNIRVNAISPGVVRTEFSRPFWSDESIYKEIVKGVPLGRIAEIEDVVQLVDYLASPRSAYVTGEIISLCGGAEA
jgi:NAD(P)-dependent dehydrogenase (short-subunit alcohol dehydrogenase family)